MNEGEVLIKYNLQLFAKDGPGGEKTEEPTGKKLTDARKDGKVAKSKEIVSSIYLLIIFVLLKVLCKYFADGFIECFKSTYNKISMLCRSGEDEINYVSVHSLTSDFFVSCLKLLAPVMIVAVVINFVGELVQVKWKITAKPMMPKLNKLNPISGFKKIFSKESLVNLVKSLAIIAICLLMVYNKLVKMKAELFNLYEIPLINAIIVIGDIIVDIGLKISGIYLLVGLFDYVFQKRRFHEDMKMTKQEVKDEYKETEGDPQVRNKIKAKMRQASQRRMMQKVPEADVVITNPTHFAVALKYDAEVNEAPIVVAKGADFLAQKIKDVARDNNVLIHEDVPLARALYHNVEVGEQIPPELYKAVAEILVLVYPNKAQRRK